MTTHPIKKPGADDLALSLETLILEAPAVHGQPQNNILARLVQNQDQQPHRLLQRLAPATTGMSVQTFRWMLGLPIHPPLTRLLNLEQLTAEGPLIAMTLLQQLLALDLRIYALAATLRKLYRCPCRRYDGPDRRRI
jgi:hypothetical protein